MPTADKLYRVRGVPIMRTGDFRDSRGIPVSFDRTDLAEIAERYDPTGAGGHEARVKIGHTSKDTDPTHGYAEKLYTSGDLLLADYAAVPGDKLTALMRTGSHPRRSVEVINHNGQYIGDISHLGAARPAIKGLAAITNKQITEMSADEIATLSEHTPIRGGEGGVMLFSEDDESNLLEEPSMPNDDVVVKLTERATEAEQTALAEKKRADGLEAENRGFKEREAQLIADQKLSDTTGEAKEFAEKHKDKLGALDLGEAAAILAFAEQLCPKIKFRDKEMSFGECLRLLLSELPIGRPPLRAAAMGGADPVTNGEFADRAKARAKEIVKAKGILFGEALDIALAEMKEDANA